MPQIYTLELTELELAFVTHALHNLRGEIFSEGCRCEAMRDQKNSDRCSANLACVSELIERLPKLDVWRQTDLVYDARRYQEPVDPSVVPQSMVD